MEFTERLALIAALKSLLELGGVETALGVGATEPFGGRLAIHVRGTEIGVVAGANAPEELVGHVRAPLQGGRERVLGSSPMLTRKPAFVVASLAALCLLRPG
jgi:4-hydroxy-3-methylbut-2-enyl diphosphate reductase IspH